MLPKSLSCLGRKRLGRPRQVLRHWQASLRQDLFHVVTGSAVLGFPSASLLVVSQLECPVSFVGAASTSAPPYKADPGHLRHCPFWSPFTTHGGIRGWVFYNPPIPGESTALHLATMHGHVETRGRTGNIRANTGGSATPTTTEPDPLGDRQGSGHQVPRKSMAQAQGARDGRG
jgi:hypothetical protein